MDLPVLFEDETLVITVKPVGLLSEDVPGGLIPALKEQLGRNELYCVHRLDRAVSGVIAVAKTKTACTALTRAFTEGKIEKRYLAVVSGRPEPARGSYKDLLFHDPRTNKTYTVDTVRKGVKPAELTYRVLAAVPCDPLSPVAELSLCEVRPLTGRTHQIRVQFASRRHPLAGDKKYGSSVGGHPVALFCRGLDLTHPATCRPVSFRALPEDTAPWSLFGGHDALLSLLAERDADRLQ